MTGRAEAVAEFLATAELPGDAEVLGPVPLPVPPGGRAGPRRPEGDPGGGAVGAGAAARAAGERGGAGRRAEVGAGGAAGRGGR